MKVSLKVRLCRLNVKGGSNGGGMIMEGLQEGLGLGSGMRRARRKAVMTSATFPFPS